ncbi:hypothetical protein [Natrarchaeobaculum aegyptiacum]|uniref:Uncharacterized protein n=1 Tax=Natrarchaeobaculum aegyptiacum TaxID=745377 RepID=A0A2Z2HQV4_9EURY|nr:hypothetical protein [Natrarchaeobaculum aegyptiacum]ARS89526.1 hypothetical protein B1756_07075 [Natrarchaeobaculum aegyptiacum]
MRLRDAITAASFWVATVMPLTYVPVFLLGLDSAFTFSLFLGLLVVNVVALVVGHEYPGSRST